MRMIHGMVILDEEGGLDQVRHSSNGKKLPDPQDRTIDRMIAWFEEAIAEIPDDGKIESMFCQEMLRVYLNQLNVWRHSGFEAPPSFQVH